MPTTINDECNKAFSNSSFVKHIRMVKTEMVKSGCPITEI
jgi:hypothetical protein